MCQELYFCAMYTGVDFMIEADEIVRCAAYFGNARKHTLFVFVVPNCTRRLPSSIGDRQPLSTLVVIFLPALGQRQIADLVYIFWRISHTSMFGLSGGLLTEIDQKAALSLLSNIKPTILSTVAERMRNIAGADFSPALESADPAITQHIAVPVAQNGLAEQSESELCGEGEVRSHKRGTHSSVGLRTSKRRLSVTHDMVDEEAIDDGDEEWSTAVARKRKHLRIKLTRNRPKIMRRRQKQTASREPPELEIAPEPEESICKTEVVDDDYELSLHQPPVDDGQFDLSALGSTEPFTIIEQWETVDGITTEAGNTMLDDDDEAQSSPLDVYVLTSSPYSTLLLCNCLLLQCYS